MSLDSSGSSSGGDQMALYSNNQLNYTDGSYEDHEQMFMAFGSTWFWDWFWLWFMTPFSFFSFVSNVLSTYIFFQSPFKSLKLYTYLRALALNSSILCFFTIYDFLFYSRRYLSLVNTYWTNFYECFIHEPITSTAYFFGSVLDLLITTDRLATFSKFFRFVPESLATWKLILAALGFCCLVNGPYYLVLRPTHYYFFIASTNETELLYTINQSEFSMTLLGRVLIFGVYFVRDFLTMALSIGLNITSLIFLKRYVEKHHALTQVRRVNGLETSFAPSPVTITGNTKMRPSISDSKKPPKKVKLASSSKVDRKASMMVMLMCLLQIIEHVVIIVSILYNNFTEDFTGQVLSRLSDFVMIAKNAFNFPIFLLFNKNFKSYFTEHFSPFRPRFD